MDGGSIEQMQFLTNGNGAIEGSGQAWVLGCDWWLACLGSIGGGLGWCWQRLKLFGDGFIAIDGLGIFLKRVVRDLEKTVVVKVVVSFYIHKVLIFLDFFSDKIKCGDDVLLCWVCLEGGRDRNIFRGVGHLRALD